MKFLYIITTQQGPYFNSLVKHHPKTFTILLPHRPEREEEKGNGLYETQMFQNQKCLEFKIKKFSFTFCLRREKVT